MRLMPKTFLDANYGNTSLFFTKIQSPFFSRNSDDFLASLIICCSLEQLVLSIPDIEAKGSKNRRKLNSMWNKCPSGRNQNLPKKSRPAAGN